MLETANTFLKQPKKPFTLLSKNGTEESIQTPREKWLKKEKNLKIKFFIILILTHSLWIFSTPLEKEVITTKELKVSEGNQIIKVPSTIMTTLPQIGKKKKVSLFIGKKLVIKKAFLWPNHQTNNIQEMAKLEISNHEVSKVNELSSDGKIKVLPYLKKVRGKRLKEHKRSIYEVHI